jgi:hypothetical protein
VLRESAHLVFGLDDEESKLRARTSELERRHEKSGLASGK